MIVKLSNYDTDLCHTMFSSPFNQKSFEKFILSIIRKIHAKSNLRLNII